MAGSISIRLAVVSAVCLSAVFATVPTVATAQSWPDLNSNVRDEVTGYLCTDPGCQTLRLPGSKCLCQKQNPWERDVRKLRLKCSVISFGNISQCPVKPKYGILVE